MDPLSHLPEQLVSCGVPYNPRERLGAGPNKTEFGEVYSVLGVEL